MADQAHVHTNPKTMRPICVPRQEFGGANLMTKGWGETLVRLHTAPTGQPGTAAETEAAVREDGDIK